MESQSLCQFVKFTQEKGINSVQVYSTKWGTIFWFSTLLCIKLDMLI
jgi:hypothetical protein